MAEPPRRGAGLRCCGGKAALAVASVLSLSLVPGAEAKGFSTRRGSNGFGKYRRKSSGIFKPARPSMPAGTQRGTPAGQDDDPWASGRPSGRKPTDGEGKGNRSPRRYARQTDRDYPLKAAIIVLADVVAFGAVGCLWCNYLESKPSYTDLRFWLLCVAGLVSAMELWLYCCGWAWLWFALATVPVNIWGMADAALRFPLSHDFGSAFSLKQISLLVLKLAMYTFGLRDLVGSALTYFSLIAFNIILVPVLYLAALPPDMWTSPKKTSPKSPKKALAEEGVDVCDVDVALRAWRVLESRERRRSFALGCARKARSVALGALDRAPGQLQDALASASPWCRQALKQGSGRRV